ncbi:MAG TPA: MFS transporter [Actinopolymorphaceae bacterium]|jgi:EmrB/QacA subfamily drug resistance transporter
MGLNRGLALLVAGTFFMENLDGTIIATAAPSMAADFGIASVDIHSAITAYLVTLAVGIPLSGWLVERLGARRVFVTAIVVFTVASALCAASTGLAMLTVMRVLQGVGGAMMVPVGRLVVLRVTAKADLVTAIAYLTWPALLAPVIAPVLGGLFATYATWRWIFLVNIPLGVVALVVALRLVPSAAGHDPGPADWRGFVLAGLGLAAIILGMDRVGYEPVPWVSVVVSVAIGVAALVLAVRHMLGSSRPLLDFRVLRVVTFRDSTSSGSVFRLVISAVPFLLPLMMQDAFGWSPVRAGGMVIAVFVGNVGIKPVTTPLMRRFGFRTVLIASTVGALFSIASFAVLTPTTPTAAFAGLLLASGVFRSVGFTAYNSIQFADIDAGEMSAANTLAASTGQLASGLGVAVGALGLRGAQAGLTILAPGASLTTAYHVSFLILAAILLVAVYGAVRMAAGAGAHVSRPVRPVRT